MRILTARRLVLALCIATASACDTAGSRTLTDLAQLDDLKARFNRDAGKTRLVLLLSPT